MCFPKGSFQHPHTFSVSFLERTLRFLVSQKNPVLTVDLFRSTVPKVKAKPKVTIKASEEPTEMNLDSTVVPKQMVAHFSSHFE